jgi:hypothetical protein
MGEASQIFDFNSNNLFEQNCQQNGRELAQEYP